MSILDKAIKYTYKVEIKLLDPFSWWDPLRLKEDGHLFIKAAYYEDPTGKCHGSRIIKETVRSYMNKDEIISYLKKEYTDRKYPWTEIFLLSFDGSTDVKFPLRQRLHGQEWILNSPSDEDISKTSLRNSEGSFELEPNQFYMLATGEKLDLEKLNISSDNK